MQVIETIAAMRTAIRQLRRERGPGATVGLVPTMGAIHAGHLSLVAACRRSCGLTTASLFVNPLQFGPTEDLARYPRTFDADCRLLESAGVDLLFAPAAAEMYPAGATTTVEVAGLSNRLDGASRPGHFRGVATIVTKLFHIVQPDTAFFGQKDAAQVAVLRAMVRDLDLPVTLQVCPTVREPDGLAMSSRNRYLTPAERHQALALHSVLTLAEQHVANGERCADCLCAVILQALKATSLHIDYVALVDPDTLEPTPRLANPTLLAIAAFSGKTRLIDNTLLYPPGL